MRNIHKTRLTEKDGNRSGCSEIAENVTNKTGKRKVGAAKLKCNTNQ